MKHNIIVNSFNDLICYSYMYNKLFNFLKNNINTIKNVLEFNLDNFFFSNIDGWKRGVETENNGFKLKFDNYHIYNDYDVKRTKRTINGRNAMYCQKLKSFFSFQFKICNDKKIKIEFENNKTIKQEINIMSFELNFALDMNCNRFSNKTYDVFNSHYYAMHDYTDTTKIRFIVLHLINDMGKHNGSSLDNLISNDWDYFNCSNLRTSIKDLNMDKIGNMFNNILFTNLNKYSCEEYIKESIKFMHGRGAIKNFSLKNCKISIVQI